MQIVSPEITSAKSFFSCLGSPRSCPGRAPAAPSADVSAPSILAERTSLERSPEGGWPQRVPGSLSASIGANECLKPGRKGTGAVAFLVTTR